MPPPPKQRPDRLSGAYHQVHVDEGERVGPLPAGAPRPRAQKPPALPALPELEPPQSATETPRNGPLPPLSNPPPVSVPTTAAERQAAELRAQLEDERRARREAQQELEKQLEGSHRHESIPASRGKRARDYAAPGAGLVTLLGLLGALLKPVLEQRTELAALRVDVQTAKLVADQDRAQALAWRKYDAARTRAWRCRFQQAGSALSRLGYVLSDVDYSDVTWVPEPLPKKSAAPRRPQAECPAFPEPPDP